MDQIRIGFERIEFDLSGFESTRIRKVPPESGYHYQPPSSIKLFCFVSAIRCEVDPMSRVIVDLPFFEGSFRLRSWRDVSKSRLGSAENSSTPSIPCSNNPFRVFQDCTLSFAGMANTQASMPQKAYSEIYGLTH